MDAFKKEAEDDLREGEAREGDLVDAGPPTPCSEFIEAFRCSEGVDERASMLIELGLRSR